eukprot:scaffold15551_cov62-Phaeocystis_antarctica.AAC.6
MLRAPQAVHRDGELLHVRRVGVGERGALDACVPATRVVAGGECRHDSSRLIERSAHLARYGVADAAARCACNAGAEWSKKAPHLRVPLHHQHDNNRSHLFYHRFRRVR